MSSPIAAVTPPTIPPTMAAVRLSPLVSFISFSLSTATLIFCAVPKRSSESVLFNVLDSIATRELTLKLEIKANETKKLVHKNSFNERFCYIKINITNSF